MNKEFYIILAIVSFIVGNWIGTVVHQSYSYSQYEQQGK